MEVGPEGAGRRIDTWLAEAAGVSRSDAQRLIAEGLVVVDGAAARRSLRLRAGQSVDVRERSQDRPAPHVATFEVRYEDEDLAVVAKPAGVVVHPASGTKGGTLVEALATRMPLAGAAGSQRPGIVHRLDKDTSGLLVVAKSDRAYDALGADMAARRIRRLYLALVTDAFRLPTGRIEAPVGRLPRARTMMGVTAAGRAAITDFRVLEALGRTSLIEAALLTGRTHQLRVHLAHIGHPIVGDPLYGKRTRPLARELGLARPFLHAARLRFIHPISGEGVDVEEPLPPELEKALMRARGLVGGR